MSRLEFRVLTADAEIDRFLECFNRFVNVRLPQSYARAGHMTGVFKDNEMIGGYMLITQGPFRSMAFVPDVIKNKLNAWDQTDGLNLVEVNGFWVAERYRRSHESLLIWLQLRKAILATKAAYLLLFYNAEAKGLAQIYESVLHPREIYRGAPMANRMASTAHREVTVSIVSRRDIRLCVYRGLGRIIARTWHARAA